MAYRLAMAWSGRRASSLLKCSRDRLTEIGSICRPLSAQSRRVLHLRDAFLGLFNQGHHTQTELFQLAQSKGWYQPEQAQADKISQAYTKFSNQKPTGQQ